MTTPYREPPPDAAPPRWLHWLLRGLAVVVLLAATFAAVCGLWRWATAPSPPLPPEACADRVHWLDYGERTSCPAGTTTETTLMHYRPLVTCRCTRRPR